MDRHTERKKVEEEAQLVAMDMINCEKELMFLEEETVLAEEDRVDRNEELTAL
jgi:hypothetical protein